MSNLEDLGIDEGVILKWILKKWDVGRMVWINLAKDRDKLLL
jgi:hypothetical protein